MKREDFTADAPGRLVPTVDGALAFVPDPLPERLELPAKTVRVLAAAENALGWLEGTTAREFDPYLIVSPLLRREAILSSRIEGTITTAEQLVLLEAGEEPSDRDARGESDTREVLNYVDSIRKGLELLKTLPVSLGVIKQTHAVLLAGVRGERELPGEFRRDQNWIADGPSASIADARFVPPPVPEMKAALSDLEKYINRQQTPESDPLLVQLALIHYHFETIHPFRDGNGRIGRLLIPLVLVSHGRLATPILYLSAYLEEHRREYMDLLLRVSRTGDWITWVNFFLRGVAEAATEANRYALALLELRQTYHRMFQKGRSSALLIRLIDRLFQTPSITINQAAALLDVSHAAAARNVHKLVDAGILRERTGRKRGQVFVADTILNFVKDQPAELPISGTS